MTLMIGIDPHKATHTAVAVNENEVVLGEFKVRASRAQVLWVPDIASGLVRGHCCVLRLRGALIGADRGEAGQTVSVSSSNAAATLRWRDRALTPSS